MKVRLYSAPWGTPELTEEVKEAVELIGEDVWKDASIEFYAMRDAKLRAKKSAPKGMQRYLNQVLEERFNKYEIGRAHV